MLWYKFGQSFEINKLKVMKKKVKEIRKKENLSTAMTASLAARVNMSAQDTVEGHILSTSAFMLSMISNPLTEFRLGPAFFSPLKRAVSSRRTEPSQPCNNHTITRLDAMSGFMTK